MPNYYTTKQFSENFLAMEMKKTKINMNVPIYIRFTILEVSKTVRWEFFYDYLSFMKTLTAMLKNGLILQIIRLIDRC